MKPYGHDLERVNQWIDDFTSYSRNHIKTARKLKDRIKKAARRKYKQLLRTQNFEE